MVALLFVIICEFIRGSDKNVINFLYDDTVLLKFITDILCFLYHFSSADPIERPIVVTNPRKLPNGTLINTIINDIIDVAPASTKIGPNAKIPGHPNHSVSAIIPTPIRNPKNPPKNLQKENMFIFLVLLFFLFLVLI